MWTPLEHKIKAELQNQGLLQKMKGKNLCVALSGGMDSVLVFHWLLRFSEVLDCQLQAAHFHHGDAGGPQASFRDQALQFVSQLCEQKNVKLFTAKHTGIPLTSEQGFREARWDFFKSLVENQGVHFIVTGHHADDLLETRLLRLIRGCGPQGLTAMTSQDGFIFRPFLSIQRKESVGYLQQLGVSHIEDPSNSDTEFLRNWLRKEWLPAIEERSPGAKDSMARSLQLIAESANSQEEPLDLWFQGDWTKGLSRPIFQTYSREQQKRWLAVYLSRLGMKDFRQTQLEEIRKNLDINQIDHTFKVAQLHWQVNAEQIRAVN